MNVSRSTYEQADAVTSRFWPHHNRTQGICWKTTAVGLVAKDADDEVGAAILKLTGGVACLEQLVVAPEKMHRGIGTLLLIEVERIACEMGCHVMELETAETQARPFYEKNGFVLVCEKPHNKFGLTWFLMEKRIAAQARK